MMVKDAKACAKGAKQGTTRAKQLDDLMDAFTTQQLKWGFLSRPVPAS